MKYKIQLLALLIFTVGNLILACQSRKPEPTVDKQTYKSTGVVKSVDTLNGKITIDHEDIPGYMSAMEMHERVLDKSLLNSIKTGDKVEFEIERTGADIVITKLTKIGETANGGEIYKTNCAACHGAVGEGAKKGIPLTSGHALAHTENEYIERVRTGKEGKMPAFRDKLSPDEIAAVVKFVREGLQKNVTDEQRTPHHH